MMVGVLEGLGGGVLVFRCGWGKVLACLLGCG